MTRKFKTPSRAYPRAILNDEEVYVRKASFVNDRGQTYYTVKSTEDRTAEEETVRSDYLQMI